jgi:SAM-dependent methyltransferase
VVEVGCGPLGGFVPVLRSSGYEAVGVDPRAPDGADYRRVEFEQAEPFKEVDSVVASTSLHHVADPGEVIARIANSLARGGTLVVVEWASEDFDEATAQWCFERLGDSDESGWLRRRRDEWVASGQPWSVYLQNWARREQIHGAETLLSLLDEHFDCEHLAHGAYYFPDLAQTSEADERAAIAAGQIRAQCVSITLAGRAELARAFRTNRGDPGLARSLRRELVSGGDAVGRVAVRAGDPQPVPMLHLR